MFMYVQAEAKLKMCMLYGEKYVLFYATYLTNMIQALAIVFWGCEQDFILRAQQGKHCLSI